MGSEPVMAKEQIEGHSVQSYLDEAISESDLA